MSVFYIALIPIFLIRFRAKYSTIFHFDILLFLLFLLFYFFQLLYIIKPVSYFYLSKLFTYTQFIFFSFKLQITCFIPSLFNKFFVYKYIESHFLLNAHSSYFILKSTYKYFFFYLSNLSSSGLFSFLFHSHIYLFFFLYFHLFIYFSVYFLRISATLNRNTGVIF